MLRVEHFFDNGVAIAYILGCVVKVALNEALEDVKEDAVARGFSWSPEYNIGRERIDLRFVVYSDDWTTECKG